ncbi:MAG: hypothetical protein AAF483_12675 [Planctomycetota bacterium]
MPTIQNFDYWTNGLSLSNPYEPIASGSASRSVAVPVRGVERPVGMPGRQGDDGSADQMSRLMLRVAGVVAFSGTFEPGWNGF